LIYGIGRTQNLIENDVFLQFGMAYTFRLSSLRYVITIPFIFNYPGCVDILLGIHLDCEYESFRNNRCVNFFAHTLMIEALVSDSCRTWHGTDTCDYIELSVSMLFSGVCVHTS